MNTTELKAYALAVSKTIKERAYMDAVAFRECEADRMAFQNDAGPMVLELIAAHEDAQGEIRALRERVKALEEGLRDLYKGYVNLLQGGKDRIESLGGACDAVDRMEADSPYLRSARALLEQKP